MPRDSEGRPDFRYVATHICDSIKRRLKAEGAAGLQGEFGIGLLSFWTVGEELAMTSTAADERPYQMMMRKGDPSYTVAPRRSLFAEGGTEVRIAPLLEGVRALSGEKIQWYLAAELRDRIRESGVRINVIDRLARKQYAVEPRQYEGRLLHQLPAAAHAGRRHLRRALSEPGPRRRTASRSTGVAPACSRTSRAARASTPPWTARYLQGLIDAPFLNLTPGTRSGIIHDERYAALSKRCSRLSRS